MKKILLVCSLFSACLLLMGLFLPMPERPLVEFEATPDFQVEIASTLDALTFAYDDDRSVLLVVEDDKKNRIKALKLDGQYQDAFDALAQIGREKLVALTKMPEGAQWYTYEQLRPITDGRWHIAFGGNFTAHADETNLEKPFAYPKIVAATKAISQLSLPTQAAMLDYEAELCMIFDRTIDSMADFNAAVKGVFLCSDTTDRATLLRDLPADEEVFGGTGFTDAKSFAGFFSTGPYLVIPNDWHRFVSYQPITTVVNGTLMQFAYGSDMIYDFEKITEFSLENGNKRYWESNDQQLKLLNDGAIEKGTALLSGTGEGVIFRPPQNIPDILAGGLAYVLTGAFLRGENGRDYVLERFIDKHVKAHVFLQPGETVQHHSKNLGSITIAVR